MVCKLMNIVIRFHKCSLSVEIYCFQISISDFFKDVYVCLNISSNCTNDKFPLILLNNISLFLMWTNIMLYMDLSGQEQD